MRKAIYLLIPVLLIGCSCQPSAVRQHDTAQTPVVLDSTGVDILHGIDSIIKQLPADSTFEFNLSSTEIKP